MLSLFGYNRQVTVRLHCCRARFAVTIWLQRKRQVTIRLQTSSNYLVTLLPSNYLVTLLHTPCNYSVTLVLHYNNNSTALAYISYSDSTATINQQEAQCELRRRSGAFWGDIRLSDFRIQPYHQ